MSDTDARDDTRSRASPGRSAERPRADDPYYIVAPAPLAGERDRVLKQGDTFAVFDHHGDIRPVGMKEQGLFHEGTRFLSCLILRLGRGEPHVPQFDRQGRQRPARGGPDQPGHSRRRHGRGPARHAASVPQHLPLGGRLLPEAPAAELRIGARRGRRSRSGSTRTSRTSSRCAARSASAAARHLPADRLGRHGRAGYEGLDGVVRRTRLEFSPAPTDLTRDRRPLPRRARPAAGGASST